MKNFCTFGNAYYRSDHSNNTNKIIPTGVDVKFIA
ncbi:hypothetical protein FHW89_004446 [Mucilaginibacter sp. SG564]|nr:hypothetical protein [Mucilaginibacter sp. SG564]